MKIFQLLYLRRENSSMIFSSLFSTIYILAFCCCCIFCPYFLDSQKGKIIQWQDIWIGDCEAEIVDWVQVSVVLGRIHFFESWDIKSIAANCLDDWGKYNSLKFRLSLKGYVSSDFSGSKSIDHPLVYP